MSDKRFILKIIFAGFTLLAAYFSTKATFDERIFAWLAPKDPLRQEMELADETFGGTNIAIVALSTPDFFKTDRLERLMALSKALKQIFGVTRILSLAEVTDMSHGDNAESGIEAKPLLGEIPVEEGELAALKSRVLSDPLLAGALISKDGKSALCISILDRTISTNKIVGAIRKAVKDHTKDAKEMEVFYIGLPFADDDIAQKTQGAMVRVGILAPIVCIGILWFTTRSLSGILLPLISGGIAALWAFGGFGAATLMGFSVPKMLALLPLILFWLGSACPMMAWMDAPLWPQKSLILLPGSLAAIALFFWGADKSLIWQEAPFYQTGFFLALGLFAAVCFSYLLLPDLKPVSFKALSSQILPQWSIFILVALSGLVFVFFGQDPSPTLDPKPILGAESEPAKGIEHLHEAFGGADFLTIRVQGNLRHPGILQKIEVLTLFLRSLPEVYDVATITDPLRQVSLAMTGHNRLSGTVDQISSLWPFLEGQPVENLVNADRTQALLQIRLKSNPPENKKREAVIKDLSGQIETFLSTHLKPRYVSVNRAVPTQNAPNLPDVENLHRAQIANDLASIHSTFTPEEIHRIQDVLQERKTLAKASIDKTSLQGQIVAFLTGEETLFPLEDKTARRIADQITKMDLSLDRLEEMILAVLKTEKIEEELSPLLYTHIQGILETEEIHLLAEKMFASLDPSHAQTLTPVGLEQILAHLNDPEVLIPLDQMPGSTEPIEEISATPSGFPLLLAKIERDAALKDPGNKVVFILVGLIAVGLFFWTSKMFYLSVMLTASAMLIFLFQKMLASGFALLTGFDPGSFAVQAACIALLLIYMIGIVARKDLIKTSGNMLAHSLLSVGLGFVLTSSGFLPMIRIGGMIILGSFLAGLWTVVGFIPLFASRADK